MARLLRSCCPCLRRGPGIIERFHHAQDKKKATVDKETKGLLSETYGLDEEVDGGEEGTLIPARTPEHSGHQSSHLARRAAPRAMCATAAQARQPWSCRDRSRRSGSRRSSTGRCAPRHTRTTAPRRPRAPTSARDSSHHRPFHLAPDSPREQVALTSEIENEFDDDDDEGDDGEEDGADGAEGDHGDEEDEEDEGGAAIVKPPRA